MKVVLDTNVLVASVEVLAEYRRVADRLHRRFSSVDISAVLDLVIRETRIVKPVPVPVSACADRDDLKFLACGLAGGAELIVTGDRAPLRASGYQGIDILTPREFARRHLER